MNFHDNFEAVNTPIALRKMRLENEILPEDNYIGFSIMKFVVSLFKIVIFEIVF